MRYLFLALFVTLVVAALLGAVNHLRDRPRPTVTKNITGIADTNVMFVSVHGIFRSRSKTMAALDRVLAARGALCEISFENHGTVNTAPAAVAAEVAARIEEAWTAHGQPDLVLVGHSVGALLLRSAFIQGYGRPWTASVRRFVLLAGMNRGWDISGHKPAELTWWRHAWFSVLVTAARLTGMGQFMLDMEAGSPFVANLRLDWMAAAQKPDFPEVVQLLGDIDDIVSDQDNKDLAAAGRDHFVWLRVRGTGHSSIVDLEEPSPEVAGTPGLQHSLERELRQYRGQKLILAATAPLDEVRHSNEELPPPVNEEVTELVFVIHGIRDLGEWSAVFESAIQTRHVERQAARIAVESSRYGYFGMGPFLLRVKRAQYVRWFMDEYTEALGKYPRLRAVHFVGHSNGTYLLAKALESYGSMKLDNVVFAGSVVPTTYDWCARFNTGQVTRVRNYVAADDWVVALFPAFFEQGIIRLLGNDVGSGGFNGFRHGTALSDGTDGSCTPDGAAVALQNVGYLTGGHGAFVNKVPEIVNFLLSPASDELPKPEFVARPTNWSWLKLTSDYLSWLVWLILVVVVIASGLAVAAAAREWAWTALGIYLAFLVLVLRHI